MDHLREGWDVVMSPRTLIVQGFGTYKIKLNKIGGMHKQEEYTMLKLDGFPNVYDASCMARATQIKGDDIYRIEVIEPDYELVSVEIYKGMEHCCCCKCSNFRP